MPEESDLRRDVALFRYRVIAEPLSLPRGSPERRAAMRAQAAQTHSIPGSSRTRVAVETIRDWIRLYEQGSFEALHPKPRKDRGRTRRLPPEVVDLLIDIKRREPHLSVRKVILEARRTVPDSVLLAPSTVSRLLRREGLTKPATAAEPRDRRRYAYRQAAEMWQVDAMHGPRVAVSSGGRRRAKAYLLSFIDDATRLVPHSAFTLSEGAAAFLPVFRKALLKRGLPVRLYADNGAAFRCRHLAVICATLGIHLINATPYAPQGRGKIERYFRTVRTQFLPSLDGRGALTLEDLNARLALWVEQEYHLAPHRGLDGEAPLDAWARSAGDVRQIGPETDIDRIFRFPHERRVRKDRTVSLFATLYEVDAALVGEKVVLLHDPAVSPSRPIPVLHDGREAGEATILDAYANTRVKRNRTAGQSGNPAPGPEPSPLPMRRLAPPKENP